MTVLALEFSSARRSVALARAGEVLAEAVEQSSARGTNAFGLIAKVLAEAGVSRGEIQAIAVGLGPGSYTGIRAAIAIAQGWQLARGIQSLGVSSVESLAAQAQAQAIFGQINLAVDAQRGEFYLARWEISHSGRREISPLTIVPATEIAARKAAGEFCVGPEMDHGLFPTAAMTGRLAAGRADFLTADKLEPIYLRAAAFHQSPGATGLLIWFDWQ